MFSSGDNSRDKSELENGAKKKYVIEYVHQRKNKNWTYYDNSSLIQGMNLHEIMNFHINKFHHVHTVIAISEYDLETNTEIVRVLNKRSMKNSGKISTKDKIKNNSGILDNILTFLCWGAFVASVVFFINVVFLSDDSGSESSPSLEQPAYSQQEYKENTTSKLNVKVQEVKKEKKAEVSILEVYVEHDEMLDGLTNGVFPFLAKVRIKNVSTGDYSWHANHTSFTISDSEGRTYDIEYFGTRTNEYGEPQRKFEIVNLLPQQSTEGWIAFSPVWSPNGVYVLNYEKQNNYIQIPIKLDNLDERKISIKFSNPPTKLIQAKY